MKAFPQIGPRVARITFRYFTIKVLLSGAILVFAASIAVQQQNFQAEYGSAMVVSNNLVATDRGFSLIALSSGGNGTNCTSPVTFGASAKNATTSITGGHLVYDVRVNTTGQSPASTKWNVTLYIAAASYGPVCIATPVSPTAGQIIDCQFDVGITLPNAPYSFRVQVG